MKAASSSETSVTIYESTQRLMTEDKNLQRLCRQTVFSVWRFVVEAQCAYVIFDSRHPDVFIVIRQQIKCTSNTSTLFIL